MSSKRVTLELVDVENAPPQEGIAFTNQYVSKYHESSQTSTSTLQHEPCFGDFELDNNSEMCQASQREK